MRALFRITAGHRSLALWAGLFVLATVWVWQRYAVVTSGNNVNQLRERIGELTEVRDALLVETTTLSSRARIEAIATAHLGLQPTTDEQWKRLPEAMDTTTIEDASTADQPIAGGL